MFGGLWKREEMNMRHGVLTRRVWWRGEEMRSERQFSRSAYLGMVTVGVQGLGCRPLAYGPESETVC